MNKKTIKTSLSFFALSALVALTAACGNNTNSISATSKNPGAGALGANVDMKSCQVGQSYTTDNGCLNRGMCQPGSGVTSQTGACVPGQLVTGLMKFGSNAGTRHFGALTITNASQMELLLQTAGLCNSAYGSFGAVAFSSAAQPCAQFITRGTFAAITSYSGVKDNVNVTIGAGAPVLTYDLASTLSALNGSSAALLGSNMNGFVAQNSVNFSQQAHNFIYNNGNGMQLVGVTPSGEPMNFMVVIDNGNLGLDHMTAKLVYLGVEVANISLDRF